MAWCLLGALRGAVGDDEQPAGALEVDARGVADADAEEPVLPVAEQRRTDIEGERQRIGGGDTWRPPRGRVDRSHRRSARRRRAQHRHRAVKPVDSVLARGAQPCRAVPQPGQQEGRGGDEGNAHQASPRTLTAVARGRGWHRPSAAPAGWRARRGSGTPEPPATRRRRWPRGFPPAARPARGRGPRRRSPCGTAPSTPASRLRPGRSTGRSGRASGGCSCRSRAPGR